MARVLVVGGGGYIGVVLFEQLLELGRDDSDLLQTEDSALATTALRRGLRQRVNAT